MAPGTMNSCSEGAKWVISSSGDMGLKSGGDFRWERETMIYKL